MAGIGFKLQKLMLSGDPHKVALAYFHSSLISTGPFFVLVLAFFFLKHGFHYVGAQINIPLFFGYLVYSYAFSMLGSGPLYYILSRHLANQHYLQNLSHFSLAYIRVLQITLGIELIVTVILCAILKINLSLSCLLIFLLLTLSAIWIALCVLSAAKSYRWIIFIFILGSSVSILGSMVCAKYFSLLGAIFGFALGQLITFILLSLRIFFEFSFQPQEKIELSQVIEHYPFLLGIGLTQSLGLWIDKFIFWFSAHAQSLGAYVKIFPNYDVPLFWAYFSVLPSLCYFLAELETGFVIRYWNFFERIEARKTLDEIRIAKEELISEIKRHFKNLFIYQGSFTLFLIFFSELIGEYLQMNSVQVQVLRIAFLGSFLMALHFVLLNLFLYFEFHFEAFCCTLLTFILNTFFSILSYKMGEKTYGYGFTLAYLFVFLFAAAYFIKKMDELEFITFTRQKLKTQAFKFDAESKKK